jgi:hypothetical protein
MIKSLQDVVKPHVIRSIYFVYFPAYLINGLILWGGNSQSTTFQITKQAIKIISGMRRYTSSSLLFKDFSMLPVLYICISEIIHHIKLYAENGKKHAAIHNYNIHQMLNSLFSFIEGIFLT